MTYNKRNIKPFKGRMVLIEYICQKNNKSYTNKLTGIITANTDVHVLFRINKERNESILRYDQIKEITIPIKE